MGDRNYSFDANLILADGVAAITADGYTQNGGADAILNLGGNQGVTPVQQARIDAMCVIDVTTIAIDGGDETYRLKIMGCNDSAFTSGVVELASMQLGDGSTMVPNTQKDSTAGRYELPFCTEQDDVKYQYIKMYVDGAGSTFSIDFFAYVVVLPEP